MSNWYTDRNALKTALGQKSSATGNHSQLDAAIEAVSRLIDDYLGFHAYPASGTRYYTAREWDCLYLDAPLLGVDSIQTSSDGGSTFGSTMTTADYYLAPYNATEESPRRPWWSIEIRPNATSSGAVFPTGLKRSTRVLGTWGYFNERKSTTARPATAINVTQTTIAVVGATSLYAGQTIVSNSEQMFITQAPTSASAGVSASGITVERARNGTTAATHSSLSTFQIYSYPIIERAALYQSEQYYRAKDTPLGFAGGEAIGVQRSFQVGGLHPFTKRMLDGFRKPVVA